MTAKHKSKNRKLQFQKWDKKTVLVSFVFLVLITLISSSFFSSSEGEGVTGFVVKKISVRAFEQLKSEAITARSKAESTRNQEDIIQAIRLYEQLIASGRVTSGQIRNYKGRIQQLDWLEPSTPLHVSTGGREAHVGQAEPGTTGDIRSASPSSSESGTGGDVAPVDSVLLQQAQQRLNTAKEEAQKFDNLRIKVGMGKEAFMDYYYERNDPLTIEYKQVHALYDQAEKKDEAEGWGEESPVPPELKKALDNVNDFSRIRKQYREEKASGQISPLVQAEYNKLREKYPFDDAKYEADFDEAKKAFDAQTNAENIFNRLQKEETVEKQYQQAITTYRTAQTSEDPEQQTLLLAQAARDLKLVERYYTEEGNAETAKKIQDELDNLLWRVISTPTRVPVDPATFTDSAQRQSAEMLNGAINEYGEKQTALSEAEQAESQCWFFCGEEEKARAQAEADVDRAGNTLRFQQLQFRLETAPSAIAEAPPSPKPETGGSLAYQVTELRSQARSVVDPAEKRRLLEQAATLAVESAKKYQEEDNLIGASGVLRLGRQSIEEAADLTAVPSVPPVAEAPPVPAPPVVVPKNAISAEDRSPVTALQNCRELNIVESCEVKDIGGRKYAVPTAQAEAFKQRQDAATERATQLASLAEGWTTGSEEGEIADLVRGVSDEDLPLLNQKFNEATGQELDDVLKDELGDEVYASLRGTPAPAPTPPEPAPPPERNALQITKPDGGGTFELDCTKHPDQCQKLRTISERLATAIVRERPKILGELRIAKLEAHNLVSPPPAGEAPLAAAPSASEPSSASAPLIEPLHAVATYGIQRAILDDTNYAIIVSELSDGTQLTAIFDDQGKRIGYQKPDGNFVRGEPEGGWPDAIADTISLQSASLQSVTRREVVARGSFAPAAPPVSEPSPAPVPEPQPAPAPEPRGISRFEQRLADADTAIQQAQQELDDCWFCGDEREALANARSERALALRMQAQSLEVQGERSGDVELLNQARRMYVESAGLYRESDREDDAETVERLLERASTNQVAMEEALAFVGPPVPEGFTPPAPVARREATPFPDADPTLPLEEERRPTAGQAEQRGASSPPPTRMSADEFNALRDRTKNARKAALKSNSVEGYDTTITSYQKLIDSGVASKAQMKNYKSKIKDLETRRKRAEAKAEEARAGAEEHRRLEEEARAEAEPEEEEEETEDEEATAGEPPAPPGRPAPPRPDKEPSVKELEKEALALAKKAKTDDEKISAANLLSDLAEKYREQGFDEEGNVRDENAVKKARALEERADALVPEMAEAYTDEELALLPQVEQPSDEERIRQAEELESFLSAAPIEIGEGTFNEDIDRGVITQGEDVDVATTSYKSLMQERGGKPSVIVVKRDDGNLVTGNLQADGNYYDSDGKYVSLLEGDELYLNPQAVKDENALADAFKTEKPTKEEATAGMKARAQREKELAEGGKEKKAKPKKAPKDKEEHSPEVLARCEAYRVATGEVAPECRAAAEEAAGSAGETGSANSFCTKVEKMNNKNICTGRDGNFYEMNAEGDTLISKGAGLRVDTTYKDDKGQSCQPGSPGCSQQHVMTDANGFVVGFKDSTGRDIVPPWQLAGKNLQSIYTQDGKINGVTRGGTGTDGWEICRVGGFSIQLGACLGQEQRCEFNNDGSCTLYDGDEAVGTLTTPRNQPPQLQTTEPCAGESETSGTITVYLDQHNNQIGQACVDNWGRRISGDELEGSCVKDGSTFTCADGRTVETENGITTTTLPDGSQQICAQGNCFTSAYRNSNGQPCDLNPIPPKVRDPSCKRVLVDKDGKTIPELRSDACRGKSGPDLALCEKMFDQAKKNPFMADVFSAAADAQGLTALVCGPSSDSDLCNNAWTQTMQAYFRNTRLGQFLAGNWEDSICSTSWGLETGTLGGGLSTLADQESVDCQGIPCVWATANKQETQRVVDEAQGQTATNLLYRINYEVGPGAICDVPPFVVDEDDSDETTQRKKNDHFRNEYIEFEVLLKNSQVTEKLDIDLDGNSDTQKLRCDQGPDRAIGGSTLIRYYTQNFDTICIKLEGNNYNAIVEETEICNTITATLPVITASDYTTEEAGAAPVGGAQDPEGLGERRASQKNSEEE